MLIATAKCVSGKCGIAFDFSTSWAVASGFYRNPKTNKEKINELVNSKSSSSVGLFTFILILGV